MDQVPHQVERRSVAGATGSRPPPPAPNRRTSLDTIVAQSGAAKTTLYANFGSKDELVAAYRRCPSFRGCPFINATAELPETSRPGRQVVTELRELLRGLAEHCRAQSLLVLAPRHQRHQSHQTGASIEIGVSKSV